jgi:hypothetical protein
MSTSAAPIGARSMPMSRLAASESDGSASTASITARPMRPPEPVTATFIGR